MFGMGWESTQTSFVTFLRFSVLTQMKTMIDVMKKLTLWQPQLSMNLRKEWKKWKCFLWKLKKVQIKP